MTTQKVFDILRKDSDTLRNVNVELSTIKGQNPERVRSREWFQVSLLNGWCHFLFPLKPWLCTFIEIRFLWSIIIDMNQKGDYRCLERSHKWEFLFLMHPVLCVFVTNKGG